MNLPRAVLEQEEQANKLYEAVYGNPNGSAEQPANQPAEPEVPPNGLQPPEPQGSQEPAANDGGQEPQAQAPESDDQQNTWEHRYKVLAGKYSSEVPRLAADNRELKNQLKELSATVERLKQAPQAKAQLVKPEEVETFGSELIDVVRRAAREELADKDNEISELKEMVQQLSNKTTKNVEVDFYTALNTKVSDWVTINDDKNFHKWLNELDDLTGIRRQDLLAQAEADRDADRVAKFFTAYKRASQSWAATANRSLEAQVAPDTGRQASAPPAKRFYTRGEIADFYGRVRRGEISDNDAIAIEADIQSAIGEGRVR